MKQEAKIRPAELRTEKELAGSLNPLVKEWFFSRFKEFSLPQLHGCMPIFERKNILISAPTGGTKTLTAFLSILNYLVGLAEKNELEEKVYAVYISPLKALNNDIAVNLTRPLAEISEIAEKKGIKLQEIRVGLRTGDTTLKDRAKMLKHSPHILVTTPESLAIILNSPRFGLMMNAIEFIVIDEIHALANKRGVHLSLSVERMQQENLMEMTRIGLSATISPLEEIAKFLTGNRDCLLADVQYLKKTDIKVLMPVGNLIDDGSFLYENTYTLLDKLVQEHKTTIIFTNTRSATERVIHHLKEKYPARYAENIGAHHSSLSKEHRYAIEQGLRDGKLKVVVSSTSLELGIDIGYVDLVILLGSPKSIARALQRIGRAGHKLHETAKGRFVVMDRDDLVECSVLAKEAIERKIDRVQIPHNCLDVLSQQIYGMAIYRVWDSEAMFDLIKKSYCYQDLSREDFLSVISYLSGEYALEHRNVYAKIWYDEKTKQIGKKGKLARVIYMTNIGTIPEESFVNVVISAGENRNQKVGVIDEAFMERLKRNDVFVLGGRKYMYLYSKGMNAYVSGSVNRSPTIPSWFSEMLPLSFDLALEISRFRKLVSEKIKDKEKCVDFIAEFLHCEKHNAEQIYNYFYEQYKLAKIPHLNKILIENFNDAGKKYVIFHALYGRRVNDALSRAYGFIAGRAGGRDIELGVSDNGFYLSGEKINVDKVIDFVTSKNLHEILGEAINSTEILNRRFRHCATRALMILRNYKGRTKSVGRQQVSSFFLLSAVKKISGEFPILKEARREVLEEVMDIDNAKIVLDAIHSGKVIVDKIDSELPSPFALNMILQAHSDLLKIEDKIDFLKRMHKAHLGMIKD